MPMAPGTRLGQYEILAPIGAGGMGEVYRARDTKLKRDVALKVLPDSFASDPERMARFQRGGGPLVALFAHAVGVERLRRPFEPETAGSPDRFLKTINRGVNFGSNSIRGPEWIRTMLNETRESWFEFLPHTTHSCRLTLFGVSPQPKSPKIPSKRPKNILPSPSR